MSRLIRGDRFRSRRILSDLSDLRIPLASLEAAAEGMASHAPIALARASGSLRAVTLSGLDNVGMMLIAASFYGRTARKTPRLVLREAEAMVTRGQAWWISDLVATRMIAPMLAHHGILALCALGRWAKIGCPWLKRTVAVTIRHGFHHRHPGFCERHDALALVLVLELICRDEHDTVREPAARAIRALCAFDPELGFRTAERWLRRGDHGLQLLRRDVWPELSAAQREYLDSLRPAEGADPLP